MIDFLEVVGPLLELAGKGVGKLADVASDGVDRLVDRLANRPIPPDDLFPAHRTDITQRYVSLPTGVRLRIAEAGPSDGDPVVLLHGWGASLYMYRHGLDELSRRGLRAIAVDLRGFGRSTRLTSRGGYTLDAYIADLLALFDALGLDAPAIVGQSMGGGLTLQFALRHSDRVRRVVLINPSGLVPLRFIPIIRALPRSLVASVGKRFVPRRVIAFILRRVAYGNPSAVTERDIDEYWSVTQLPGAVQAARAALGDFDWRPVSNEEANHLSVPALVVLGRSDRLILNTEESARRLRGARVETLEGGHCVHEERPRETYRVIGDFLAR